MARIWTLRCSGIQLTRYGHSCVMQQCVVVLVRAPLYALRNAALPHAVGCPAGTPLGMIDPRWSDRQILRSSDRQIMRSRDRDPIRVMIHDTPNGQIWGSKYPTYEFDHVQTNGSNSLDTREMDPIVLLRGRVTTRSKTRASHDPNGVWNRSHPM